MTLIVTSPILGQKKTKKKTKPHNSYFTTTIVILILLAKILRDKTRKVLPFQNKTIKGVIYNYNSPKVEEPSPVAYSLPDPELPEAFVGTPVTKASQRISR